MTRVLIVDDEIDTLNLLRTILDLSGYQAFTTLNSVEAITLAELEQPDCILLDIMMPQLDGFTLCKMMRLHPATAHLPIVFVTAYSALDLEDRRKDAGADMVLPKPIGMDTLIEAVEKAITMRDSTEAKAIAIIDTSDSPLPGLAQKAGIAEPTSEAKPEAKVERLPETVPAPTAEAKADAVTAAGPESKAEPPIEAKPEVVPAPTAEAKADTVTTTKPEIKAETPSEPKPEVVPAPTVEAKADTVTTTKPEIKAEPPIEARVESAPETKTEPPAQLLPAKDGPKVEVPAQNEQPSSQITVGVQPEAKPEPANNTNTVGSANTSTAAPVPNEKGNL